MIQLMIFQFVSASLKIVIHKTICLNNHHIFKPQTEKEKISTNNYTNDSKNTYTKANFPSSKLLGIKFPNN